MKKLVRLTESDLHKIVRESVNKVLNELNEGAFDDFDKEIENYWRKNRNQEIEKQANASNERMKRNAKAYSAQVNGRNRTSLGGWGSGYRQNDRTDQAGHIRALDDELAAHDAGLR